MDSVVLPAALADSVAALDGHIPHHRCTSATLTIRVVDGTLRAALSTEAACIALADDDSQDPALGRTRSMRNIGAVFALVFALAGPGVVFAFGAGHHVLAAALVAVSVAAVGHLADIRRAPR